MGYEDTKWADIAAEVGVGSTALYHYYESKLHCLFEIMSETLGMFRDMFNEITQRHDTFDDGFHALMAAIFALDDETVSRCRVLVAEQGRLGQPRRVGREEEARLQALSLTRGLEVAWAHYLSRGMATRSIPEADPRLLTRATLGLYNSIWHWYRPRGATSLRDVRDFYTARMMLMIGLEQRATPQKASPA